MGPFKLSVYDGTMLESAKGIIWESSSVLRFSMLEIGLSLMWKGLHSQRQVCAPMDVFGEIREMLYVI